MTSNRMPGLDFGLGETADMIRSSVESFAQAEIAPRAEEIDASNEFPRDLWPRLGDLGLLGITVDGGGRRQRAWLSGALRGHGGGEPGVGLGRAQLRRALQPLRQPDQAERHTRAARALPAQADLGRACRRARHERAGRGLGRGGDAHAGRYARATATSSTAPRCGSPTGRTPRSSWSTPRPTRTPAAGASPPSSSRRGCPASPPPKSSTSSACAAPTPQNWCSRTARSRRRT